MTTLGQSILGLEGHRGKLRITSCNNNKDKHVKQQRAFLIHANKEKHDQ